MDSFHSAYKLNSYLVRSIYSLERTVGSYKCKSRRCQVYNSIAEADSFTYSNYHTNFKINHRLDCNKRCLIYLITCNRRLKQYVGQAIDEFRRRWNNYKDNARKFERGEHGMQRHLYEPFNLSCHSGFLIHVFVTFIDKADPKDPTKREDYRVHTLKTKTPLGLNVEDGLWAKLIVFCFIVSVYERTVFGQ